MKAQPRTRFVIVRDAADGGSLTYFVEVGLRIFWTCSLDPEAAYLFTSRVDASTVLTRNGKHRQGWRVVKELR